jgi:hypothetical protein
MLDPVTPATKLDSTSGPNLFLLQTLIFASDVTTQLPNQST